MRKNKKILLGAVSALSLVAIGTGAVSTFAWYQVNTNVGVKSVADDVTSITTSATNLNAGSYTLTFKITDQSSEINSITKQLSYNDSGTLKVGSYFAQTSGVREATAASAGDVLQSIGVSVQWTSAPDNADDRTYLSGKAITGATLVAAGNVKLTNHDDQVTSITDYTTLYIKVVPTYADSAWSFAVTLHTADTCTNENKLTSADVGVRIATNNHGGAEYVTADEISAAGGTKFGQTSANLDAGAVYHTSDALSIPGDVDLNIA